jgi:hypothetical protein
MKYTGKLGILLAALALASCDFMTPLPEPVLNLSEFDYYVFASQDMLTDDISATSRATVNVHTGSRPFEDGIIENYPEVGQTTDYYVIPLGSNLYQITAITTYPDESSIRDTIEEYRVLDTGDIGTWEASDPIVNDSNVQDNKYRFNFYTRLRDFTTRTEQILEDKHEDNVNYKIFDDFSDFSLPDSEAELLAPDSEWSSKVGYYMAIPFWSNSNFWRSWNTKRLIGLRYYSEDTIDGKKIQSYVIFEKIVNGGGVSIADATPAQIFGDSGYKELAFNVIKVHIVDGVKLSRVNTIYTTLTNSGRPLGSLMKSPLT